MTNAKSTISYDACPECGGKAKVQTIDAGDQAGIITIVTCLDCGWGN